MDNIAAWLASITWPIVTRVFTAMGFGTVSYLGASEALTAALDAGKASFTGMSSDIINLLAMAGFFESMSIMSGGIISGLSWIILKKFALQTVGS